MFHCDGCLTVRKSAYNEQLTQSTRDHIPKSGLGGELSNSPHQQLVHTRALKPTTSHILKIALAKAKHQWILWSVSVLNAHTCQSLVAKLYAAPCARSQRRFLRNLCDLAADTGCVMH
eukprot:1867129-Amphidinium_carterae.1